MPLTPAMTFQHGPRLLRLAGPMLLSALTVTLMRVLVGHARGAGQQRWLNQHQSKLAAIENLTVLTLNPALVNRLAETLERVVEWSVTVTEGVLYLTRRGETLESPLTIVQGVR